MSTGESGGLLGLGSSLLSGLGKPNSSRQVLDLRQNLIILIFAPRYAFPPLLQDVIAKDIGLSSAQLANSNIVALLAT
jgi:hypothetical protein